MNIVVVVKNTYTGGAFVSAGVPTSGNNEIRHPNLLNATGALLRLSPKGF